MAQIYRYWPNEAAIKRLVDTVLCVRDVDRGIAAKERKDNAGMAAKRHKRRKKTADGVMQSPLPP
jgi:hypothetical protein